MKKTLSRFVVSGLLAGALCLSLPAEAGGPFQFFTLTPCRLADTRDLVGPSGGPILQDQITRQLPVQGLCNVPIGAAAVTVNVTAVVPNGPGGLPDAVPVGHRDAGRVVAELRGWRAGLGERSDRAAGRSEPTGSRFYPEGQRSEPD